MSINSPASSIPVGYGGYGGASSEYQGVLPIEITGGREGMWGIRNRNMIPLGGVVNLRNATLEDHTWRTGGGASLFGVALSGAPSILAAKDWWPDAATQRTVVAANDGTIQKDDGTGNAWSTLASGLAAGGNPYFSLGGAEAAGNARRLFFCDGLNPPRVLNGDGATIDLLANPAADWTGVNQPWGMVPHQGRNWAWGNANFPHTLYYTGLTDHSNFVTGVGTINVFPGEGQRIVAAVSFKGGLLVWKYPEFAYFIDTSSADPTTWAVKRVGQAGSCGPATATLLEDDALWVSPDGSWHLFSATLATGSVHAEDIAYRKLGAYWRENLNAANLQKAQLAYYAQKQVVMLACSGAGQTAKNRRLDMDLNRQSDLGERWVIWDRDDNEALFIRKNLSGVLTPMMGDNAGQLWTLDTAARNKNGAGYTFEMFMADTDFAQIIPSWAGRRKNLRYLILEYDPRAQGTVNVETWADGKLLQVIPFTLISGTSLILPFILPATFGATTLTASPKRRLYGRGTRIAIRAYTTTANTDMSISRIILGVELGE